MEAYTTAYDALAVLTTDSTDEEINEAVAAVKASIVEVESAYSKLSETEKETYALDIAMIEYSAPYLDHYKVYLANEENVLTFTLRYAQVSELDMDHLSDDDIALIEELLGVYNSLPEELKPLVLTSNALTTGDIDNYNAIVNGETTTTAVTTTTTTSTTEKPGDVDTDGMAPMGFVILAVAAGAVLLASKRKQK